MFVHVRITLESGVENVRSCVCILIFELLLCCYTVAVDSLLYHCEVVRRRWRRQKGATDRIVGILFIYLFIFSCSVKGACKIFSVGWNVLLVGRIVALLSFVSFRFVWLLWILVTLKRTCLWILYVKGSLCVYLYASIEMNGSHFFAGLHTSTSDKDFPAASNRTEILKTEPRAL